MEWNNKTLKKVSLLSKIGGKTTLISGEKARYYFKKGQQLEIFLERGANQISTSFFIEFYN